MSKFAERLRELREESGLSTMQLGKATGFSNASISRWENGVHVPNVDILIVFAKYFKVSTDYMCGLED